MKPLAFRRREMKRRILNGIAMMASDGCAWEFVGDDQRTLGLSDETTQAVVDEVAAEIWRRAERLPVLQTEDSEGHGRPRPS